MKALLFVLLALVGCDSTNSTQPPCLAAWDEVHKNLINVQSDAACTNIQQTCHCDPTATSTRVSKEYFCGNDRVLVDYYPGLNLEIQTRVVYPLTLDSNKGVPSYVKGDPLLEACFQQRIDISKCTQGSTLTWCDPA